MTTQPPIQDSELYTIIRQGLMWAKGYVDSQRHALEVEQTPTPIDKAIAAMNMGAATPYGVLSREEDKQKTCPAPANLPGVCLGCGTQTTNLRTHQCHAFNYMGASGADCARAEASIAGDVHQNQAEPSPATYAGGTTERHEPEPSDSSMPPKRESTQPDDSLDAKPCETPLETLIEWYNSPNASTANRFQYFYALCRHLKWLELQRAHQPEREIIEAPLPEIGDYVLATKYSDGDPGDAWGVGYYDGMEYGDRHSIKDGCGGQIRFNGFRRVGKITAEYGNWLMINSAMLEKSPPGMINLWRILNIIPGYLPEADHLHYLPLIKTDSKDGEGK